MLSNYDHNAIYILSPLSERGIDDFNFYTAKAHKIPIRRLPNRLFNEEERQRRLHCNHLVAVLNVMKFYNDWELAFESGIPSRRIKNPDLYAKEEMFRVRITEQQFKLTETQT